jgi:hypothetical protein
MKAKLCLSMYGENAIGLENRVLRTLGVKIEEIK